MLRALLKRFPRIELYLAVPLTLLVLAVVFQERVQAACERFGYQVHPQTLTGLLIAFGCASVALSMGLWALLGTEGHRVGTKRCVATLRAAVRRFVRLVMGWFQRLRLIVLAAALVAFCVIFQTELSAFIRLLGTWAVQVWEAMPTAEVRNARIATLGQWVADAGAVVLSLAASALVELVRPFRETWRWLVENYSTTQLAVMVIVTPLTVLLTFPALRQFTRRATSSGAALGHAASSKLNHWFDPLGAVDKALSDFGREEKTWNWPPSEYVKMAEKEIHKPGRVTKLYQNMEAPLGLWLFSHVLTAPIAVLYMMAVDFNRTMISRRGIWPDSRGDAMWINFRECFIFISAILLFCATCISIKIYLDNRESALSYPNEYRKYKIAVQKRASFYHNEHLLYLENKKKEDEARRIQNLISDAENWEKIILQKWLSFGAYHSFGTNYTEEELRERFRAQFRRLVPGVPIGIEPYLKNPEVKSVVTGLLSH